MRHQPGMQPRRPLHPAPRRQQQERSGRQHRQEHPRHSQSQRHGTQYDQQIIHDSNSRPKSNKNHLYRLLPAILSILLSTTAAKPAIRCRCGSRFPHVPSLQPLYGIFPPFPFPQRQQNPRFGAVAEAAFPMYPLYSPCTASSLRLPFPQRQQNPRFGAVAASAISQSVKSCIVLSDRN